MHFLDCNLQPSPGGVVGTFAGMAKRVIRLNEELHAARKQLARYSEALLEIQRTILPQRAPEVPGLDVAMYSCGADSVGGDYYDVYPVAPDQWAIVIADVSGHGLAAAAIVALVHALGSALQGRRVPVAPGAALAMINKPLATRYLANSGQFVTTFVALYDARSRVLTYSSAGHPPPRLVRGCEVHRLDAVSGLPLGIEKASEYWNATLHLQAGDRLVLFTDGITESPNEAHELFGDERLNAAACAPALTAADLVGRVVDSVRTFRSGRPANDDETCLVALVNAGPAATSEARK